MMNDDDLQLLRERVSNIHEGREITDEEFFQSYKRLVEEYSQLFPDEGRLKSLESVVEFMFMFVNNSEFVSPFNVNALTHFSHQLIEEYLLEEGSWEDAEDIAFKILTYKALNTTYGEGREGIITSYNSWATIIEIISEDRYIVDKKDLMLHLFLRLITMYDHDVLYSPALHFWNHFLDKYGAPELTPGHIKKQIDYYEFVEQSRSYNPGIIVDVFTRIKSFTKHLKCEEINDRLDDGIYKHSNL
jgi:hypothetical protein